MFALIQTRFVTFDEESLLACSFFLLLFCFWYFLSGEVANVFDSKKNSIEEFFKANLKNKVVVLNEAVQEQYFYINFNKTYLNLLKDASEVITAYLIKLNQSTNKLVHYFFNQLIGNILKSQAIFRSNFKLFIFINWTNLMVQREFVDATV